MSGVEGLDGNGYQRQQEAHYIDFILTFGQHVLKIFERLQYLRSNRLFDGQCLFAKLPPHARVSCKYEEDMTDRNANLVASSKEDIHKHCSDLSSILRDFEQLLSEYITSLSLSVRCLCRFLFSLGCLVNESFEHCMNFFAILLPLMIPATQKS